MVFVGAQGALPDSMAADEENTWTLERQLSRPGAVTSCAWSPDGMRLVSVGGGLVGVWDVFTGREVGTRPRTDCSPAPFSPRPQPRPPLTHPAPPLPLALLPPISFVAGPNQATCCCLSGGSQGQERLPRFTFFTDVLSNRIPPNPHRESAITCEPQMEIPRNLRFRAEVSGCSKHMKVQIALVSRKAPVGLPHFPETGTLSVC